MLQELAPGTPIVESRNGVVDSALVFPPNPEEVRMRRSSSHECGESHVHEEFVSEVLSIEAGLEESALVEQFRALKALRVKGVVQSALGLRVVQGVGSRIDLIVPPHTFPSHLTGQVVVIRRG